MLKFKGGYICALDLGSSKIAAIVARLQKGRISNLFFESAASRGIKKGVVIDSIGLVGSISSVLKALKARSGINIKEVHTNISGQDIITKHSRAIIPLAERGNKVITLSDLEKVNEQARVLASSLEEEILHQIPFSYSIDSRSNILNPLGLYSHRLEVDLYLVCAKLSSVQSIDRAVSQAGLEIKRLYFSGLATSRVALNKGPRQGVDILCDIGSDITELLIFKDGMLKDIEILSFGGDDFTSELSDVIKIPFDLAEETKKSHAAIGDAGQVKDDKEILLKKDRIYRPIKQKVILEITTAKAKSICGDIKGALDQKVNYSEVNNFTVTGRTVLIDGFLEALEATLGLPVTLGRITDASLAGFLDKIDSSRREKYLNYITSLGLVSEALNAARPKILPTVAPAKNIFLRTINRFKEVYQEYF